MYRIIVNDDCEDIRYAGLSLSEARRKAYYIQKNEYVDVEIVTAEPTPSDQSMSYKTVEKWIYETM